MRTLGMPLLALAAPALFAGACGKDDNVHSPAVVDFPHAFPEAPRQLVEQHAPAFGTGHGLAATDRWLYVTDRDNKALVRMDRATLTVDATLPLSSKPEQIVAPSDDIALVTLRGGELVRVVDMKVEKQVRLGVEAWGVALSDDARTAYVTLPRERQLAMVDVASLEEVDRVDTLDEPRGVIFAGSTVNAPDYVTVIHQHTGAMQYQIDSDGFVDEASSRAVSMRIGSPADHLTQTRLHGLLATRALAGAVNPENGVVYVAHVVAAPGTEADFRASEVAATPDQPAAPADGGGYGSTAVPGATVTLPTRPVEVAVTATMYDGALAPESELPVQDPATGEDMLGLVDQPSDLAHHPTHTLLFMTGYGTDNVLVMSTAEGDPMRSPIGIISVGHAPRAIAFSPDGETAYVLNEFDLSVSEVDVRPFLSMSTFPNPGSVGLDSLTTGSGAVSVPVDANGCASDMGCKPAVFAGSDPTPSSLRVNPIRVQAKQSKAYGVDPMPAQLRRGARVYTYARNENLSHAGQFACASCHFEGREDKLVWFVPDGPRQTPSLAGRLLGTAPFNWNGSKELLKSNMEQTVTRMGGLGLTSQEIDDLEQFLLNGLEAPVNPYLAVDGTLTPQQALGKQIFESEDAGCSSCHRPGQAFTDGFEHDVGTASQLEVARYEVQRASDPDAHEPGRLNTPTLKGLFYTAPYLHDGSAADLYDVLDRTATTMGYTKDLSKEQKDALVAYLLTL